MPKLVGCLTDLPREYAEEKLLRMLGVFRNGNYSTAMWIEESIGLYIGWGTQKSLYTNEMPLRNNLEDLILFFSGEEFAEQEIQRRTNKGGHQFNVPDPSCLVDVYEEDSRFPAGLNGRFHGVLIDRKRKIAVLFNDRYGMHRMYYHEGDDGFYFAAEAKAILAACPETRRMDLRGVGEFVSCGSTLEGRTLFEGIEALQGGARWVLRNRSIVEKQTYFEPQEWENQEPLEPESYYRELRDVFSGTLPRYFQGPEPIGMSLTGGLDTRMIMAWQKRSPGLLPCYTFGGALRDCQDVTLARQIARMCGQPHEVIRVGDEFLSSFSDYAERSILLSDGCVDVSRAPDLYLNEKARQLAPVRMSGVYGGEVLRQVRTLKPEEIQSGLFAEEFRCYIQQAKKTCAGFIPGHPVSFAVFKQAPWSQYGILALEQTQLSVRTPFLDNDLVRTAFRAPQSALSSNQTCIRLIADGNRALLPIPTDRALCLGRPNLLGTASHALLEFLFKAEYAYDVGMPQWLARIDHALSSLHFESLFLGRHKISHFRLWYRDALASYVREVLLDPRSLSRPYLERSGLESIVRGHLKGNCNYTLEIHKVLSLELVQRLLLDAACYRSSNDGRHAIASSFN